MDFGAGTTRASVAHFPEIVFFIAQNNAAFVLYNPFPDVPRFLIEGNPIFFVPLEYRHINAVFG